MWAWRFALAVGIAQLGWQQRHQIIEKLSQCSSRQRKGDCSGIPLAWDHQRGQSSWQNGFPNGFGNVGHPCCWGSRAYWTWDAAIGSCGRFCSSQFDHGCRLSIYHGNAQKLIETRTSMWSSDMTFVLGGCTFLGLRQHTWVHKRRSYWDNDLQIILSLGTL